MCVCIGEGPGGGGWVRRWSGEATRGERATWLRQHSLLPVKHTAEKRATRKKCRRVQNTHIHTHLLCGGVSRKALLFIETKTSVPGSRPRTPEEWKNRDCRFRLLRVSTENQNHQINQPINRTIKLQSINQSIKRQPINRSIDRTIKLQSINQSINPWSFRSINNRSTRIPLLKFNQISQSIGPPISCFEFSQSSESINRSSEPETKKSL